MPHEAIKAWQKTSPKWKEYRKKYCGQKQTILNALKAKPCADCNKQYPPYVMDFDHRSGKKFGLAGKAWKPLPELLEEAAKCDVVCANCHRERTYQRNHIAISEGTGRESTRPSED